MPYYNKMPPTAAKKVKSAKNVGGRGVYMDITDIRIRRVNADGKLKAYVTVTFDECFVVHNVKIIEGKTGTFIAMPSRKTKTGEYKDVAHPINPEFRSLLQARILDAFGNLSEDEMEVLEEVEEE
jgi:stage V sporulation protein G